MRRLYIIFFSFLLGCFFCYSQNKQLLYDFNEIPQSLLLNPGMETDFKWYAGMPLLSGTSFQIGFSGASVNDIFADDGLDINDKIREHIILGMNARDELSGTYQLELLNFGFRGKKNKRNFYSFGLYNEGDAIGYWFEDLALLAYEGNADRLGKRFDLGHFKTRGDILNVFHFGLNKQVDKKLTIGGRAKIYSSIVNFQSTKNNGYFVTDQGRNNLLSSTLVADVQLRTSGFNALGTALDNNTLGSTLLKKAFFGGDLGLGIDLGFTYRLNERTYVTGSLLDLGFIYHSKDVRSFTLKGDVSTEGLEIIFPGAAINPNRDFWQDLVDDIEELVPFQENNDSYITYRPTKLNASIRHDFGEQLQNRQDCDCGDIYSSANRRVRYANSIGGQLYVINRPRGPQAAITAFYQRRLGNVMALKATYTADKFSYTNLGLGVSIQAGPANLYFMADNLLAYRNIPAAKYASFQLGLNIISWGKK